MPPRMTSFHASGIATRIKELQLHREKGNENGFSKEFQALEEQEVKNLRHFSRKEGSRASNQSRNRYDNALPFDHTRVILNEPWPHDYINANYIRPEEELFAGSEKSYIATQGCLSSTIADFWYMIWQENSRVIVSTTKEFERSKEKVAHYWPDRGQVKKLKGGIRLTLVRETLNPDFILREISLTKDGLDRVIYQFHFIKWPDARVPGDPKCLLHLISEVNSRQQSVGNAAGPVVVHCSAGIGRTGTFIIINLILDQIRRMGLNTEVDISMTLQMVRTQRPAMVQNEIQYQFVYLFVSHYVAILKQRLKGQKNENHNAAQQDEKNENPKDNSNYDESESDDDSRQQSSNYSRDRRHRHRHQPRTRRSSHRSRSGRREGGGGFRDSSYQRYSRNRRPPRRRRRSRKTRGHRGGGGGHDGSSSRRRDQSYQSFGRDRRRRRRYRR